MAVLGASLLAAALLDCQHAEAAVHRMKLSKRSDEEFVNAKLSRAREHHDHHQNQEGGEGEGADEPM